MSYAKASHNAPFGTENSQQNVMKIIGGKPIYMKENDEFWYKYNLSSTFPPRQQELLPEIFKEEPLGETQPPRNHHDHLRPTNFNPHEYLSKDSRLSSRSTFAKVDRLVIEEKEQEKDSQEQSFLPPITPTDSCTSSHSPKHANEIYSHFRAEPSNSLHSPDVIVDNGLKSTIYSELKDFNLSKLKNIYLELSAYDRSLTGFIKYKNVCRAFHRNQVYLSSAILAKLCTKFSRLGDLDLDDINYEQLLSFVASSLKLQHPNLPNKWEKPSYDKEHLSRIDVTNQIAETSTLWSPRKSQGSGNNKKFTMQENADLRRRVLQKVVASGRKLNLEKVNLLFGENDRGHRGRFSLEQILELSRKCSVPLSNDTIYEILLRCDPNYGQYSWPKYLEFLEKLLPVTTGLPIPNSRRPLDFVKQLPDPSPSWPLQLDQQVTPRGGIEKAAQQFDLPLHSGDCESSGDDSELEPYMSTRGRSLTSLQRELAANGQSQSQHRLARISSEHEKHKHEPWLHRLMKLGKALYKSQTTNDGYISHGDAQWLVAEYNKAYNLALSPAQVAASLDRSNSAAGVNIEWLLKDLANTA